MTCLYNKPFFLKSSNLSYENTQKKILEKTGFTNLHFLNAKEFSEVNLWTNFLNCETDYIIIANCEFEVAEDFQNKLRDLLQEINNYEFDCLFLGCTYRRSIFDGRIFVDKQHLINAQKTRSYVKNPFIGSNNLIYAINKNCARILLSGLQPPETEIKSSLLFNNLVDKKYVKVFASTEQINGINLIRIDTNQMGLFKTIRSSSEALKLEATIDKNSDQWLEFEGPTTIPYTPSKYSENLFFNRFTNIPSNGIAFLKDAFASYEGYILTHKKQILNELNSIGPINSRTERDSKLFLQILKNIKQKDIKTKSLKCLYLRSTQDHIYGHALLGSVPKSIIAKNLINSYNIDYDCVILPNNFKHNDFIIKYLKIDPSKILDIKKEELLSFKEIIAPTHRSPNRLYRLNNFSFLKEFFNLSEIKPFRKIYVSREGHSRTPINEEDVIGLFRAYDFEIINPDTEKRFLPQLFHECYIVAGLHGSNLADICCSQKNTKIIDILSPFHIYQYFSSLAYSIGGQYISHIGEIQDVDKLTYSVNINKLKTLLENISKN